MLKQPTPTYQPKKKNEKQEKGGRSNNLPAKKKKTKKRGATYQVPANSFILNFSIPSTSSFSTINFHTPEPLFININFSHYLFNQNPLLLWTNQSTQKRYQLV